MRLGIFGDDPSIGDINLMMDLINDLPFDENSLHLFRSVIKTKRNSFLFCRPSFRQELLHFAYFCSNWNVDDDSWRRSRSLNASLGVAIFW